mmetsp:Transcript_67507/g.213652  ORF Transcript_67507/g.213652 Transcript_67507/m.213652 type:complete len:243 (-) Transcript_67507:141-869(-)
MGCHAMDVTSRPCPLNDFTSFIVRMSYSLQSWSRLAVRSQLPLLFHFTCRTVFLWPCRVVSCLPPRASQSFTSPSLAPLASRDMLGCQCTLLTSPPWPVRLCSCLADLKSQTLIVVSSEQLANLRSLGEKEMARTASLWAVGMALTLFIDVCQYLMHPASSPVTSHFSLWLQHMARMGTSCACRMVSKLKLIPFHSVNSPDWHPVMSRRPSGVHTTALMLQRILFVLTCTNLVLMLDAGLSK